MSDSEKVAWFKCLAGSWAIIAAPLVLIGMFGAKPNAPLANFLTIWAWMFLGFTASYLLILSWRAAYLSGKKKR